jgi:hypothetical protein
MPGIPLGTLTGARLLALRGGVTFRGLSPYYWAASTSPGWERWHRVIGVEQELGVPTATLAGIPSVRIRGGAAYSLDEPWRHRARVYASVAFRP